VSKKDANAAQAGGPEDIIPFLNQTIVWSRQLTAEQQLVSEPSDALFLNDSRQVADQVVKLVGLDEKANTLVRDLSGGQTQRLYFALAICGDPEVLFLDEPTVGMDVEGRRVFLRAIRIQVTV